MKKNKYHQKLQDKVVKNTKSKIFSGLILVAFFFVGMYGYRCLSEKVCDIPLVERFIRSDNTIVTPKGKLTVEVADTKSSRELGLSGRPSMGKEEGMLFVFDVPGRYGFWMKDMLFPLDIVWINQNGFVVEVERNAKPESYPKTYMNASPASYVLELNSGIAEEQGIFIGSKVKIQK
jgi:uncharacterized membrane protein (UPF0127 family)